jgi:Family of unknown function (DUF6193)
LNCSTNQSGTSRYPCFVVRKLSSNISNSALVISGLWDIEDGFPQDGLRGTFYGHPPFLGFSRTTGFPYTFDLPLIDARNGIFIVTDYDGKVFGRYESPEEAIALVASLLPPHCKRAISGTCENLPETDAWHQTKSIE